MGGVNSTGRGGNRRESSQQELLAAKQKRLDRGESHLVTMTTDMAGNPLALNLGRFGESTNQQGHDAYVMTPSKGVMTYNERKMRLC